MKESKRCIWNGLGGGAGREKCNYIIILKMKERKEERKKKRKRGVNVVQWLNVGPEITFVTAFKKSSLFIA